MQNSNYSDKRKIRRRTHTHTHAHPYVVVDPSQYAPHPPYLREFVLTTVILLPGVGNPGSVLGGLTPFPGNPLNPVNPVNPLENSRGLQKRYKNHQNRTLGRENGSHFGGGVVIYPTRAHFRSSGLIYEPTNHTF